MATTLEYGKKILIKRMIKSLEDEGYKVEYAPDYEGFIVADRRDDPNIFLLAANTIDGIRNANAGKPAAFVDAVISFVRSNISLSAPSVPPTAEAMRDSSMPPAASSIPPPLDEAAAAAAEYADVDDAVNLDDQAMQILDAPTGDDVGESDDLEEISNIIPEDDLNKD
jgi:hypothetical protein